MAEEPIDTMNTNLWIMELISIKEKEKSAIMEAEAKRSHHGK